MRPADSRLQSIGATFAVHFHTALVQAPETLAALYTPTAHVSHCFRKASGPAEIAALLTSTTAANVKEVKLSDVATTRTPAGAIKVTITGEFLRTSGEPQAFTQEVELRELESNTFGITSDQLSHDAAAAGGAAAKWAEPEEEVKQKAPGSSVEPKEGVASRTSTPAPAPAAAAVAAEPTPAAAAAPAAEPAKRPSSFAEALKAKKMSEGPAFSNKAVRVVAAGDKTEKTDAAAAADAGETAKPERKNAHKKDEKSAGAAKPRGGAADGAAAAPASAAAAAVVYYDIILKELAATVTEEEVRALVSPVAAVKLVNIVKSEKRRRGKDGDAAAAAAAATTITFAFVQIERPADAAASHVKEVVSKLSEQNKELHVEEVRERKPAAGRAAGGAARKPMEGGRGRKRGEQAPAAAAAAGATKAKAAGPAKAQ